MKFQKSLLAAALAVVGFGAQAAEPKQQANITQYTVDGKKAVVGEKTFIKIDSFANGAEAVGDLKVGQIYEYDGTSIKGKSTITAGYSTYAAGMVEIVKTDVKAEDPSQPNIPKDKVEVSLVDNVAQNNYWSYEDKSTSNDVGVIAGKDGYTLSLKGKLVNTENPGTNANNYAADINTDILEVRPQPGKSNILTTETSSKKDVHIGNVTQTKVKDVNGNSVGAQAIDSAGNILANYDFMLADNNAQGTLATVKNAADKTTAVTALTGKGLAVLDVATTDAKGNKAVVDLENGTVSFTTITGEQKTEKNIALTSYKDKAGKSIVGFGGEYYAVGDKNEDNSLRLTKLTTKPNDLTQDGYGLAETDIGGTKTTSVNTGLVSNKNVTYGEEVISVENAGTIVTASTDPSNANSHSGTTYKVVPNKAEVKTSKNVVTGIINEDAKNGKTYGLQATTVVDNKVTAQTTVTAEGIKTTGDITFVDAETQKETSVKGYLAETSKAVDAKIDSALVEVDSRLQQFNTTAARLNSRIDDVEKTSYRGIAIALAAQQQIPNIAAGQTAVFGGVGHYEGESAAALGLATVLADGRTSLSAALGVAGGSEVGGRVGVAYVFGGK